MKKLLMMTIALILMFLVACNDSTSNSSSSTDHSSTDQPSETKSEVAAPTGPLTIVWYPNESGSELAGAREALGEVIKEATGLEVQHRTTTDYNIAIETIANGNADLAFMGAIGYIEANNRNNAVQPLVIPSGQSGTADDAVYYGWLGVKKRKC